MALQDVGPAETEITKALLGGSAEDWDALETAADALAEESVFAEWAGGVVVGVRTVDGEERPVHQMPYPIYSSAVERLWECLAALGLIVPFAWPNWDRLPLYRDHPSRLATAPVSDAVRILVAVKRSERFVDGSIEGALDSRLVQTAVARLIRWHTEEATQKG